MGKTMKHLQQGINVAWIGVTGIGNSWGINYLLITYIKNLGSFSHILLHIGDLFIDFYLDTDEEVILNIETCETILELEHKFRKYKLKYPGKVVLLMELHESETNPGITGSALVATTNEDPLRRLKTMEYCSMTWFLVDPLHPLDMEMSVRVLYRIDPSDYGISRIINGVGGEEAVMEEVRRRMKRVGGITRLIFRDPENFKSNVACHGSLQGFYAFMKGLTFFDVSPDITYFLSPFSRPFVEKPHFGVCRGRSLAIRCHGRVTDSGAETIL